MRPRRLKNEINVVPYIDVMLVLLVIFMVTAPMMTPSSIDVPSVGKAAQPPAEAVYVNIREGGAISLSGPNTPKKSVSRGELARAVADIQDRNPEQAFLIAADKNLKYDTVIGVYEELAGKGVKRIGFLVQPTGK